MWESLTAPEFRSVLCFSLRIRNVIKLSRLHTSPSCLPYGTTHTYSYTCQYHGKHISVSACARICAELAWQRAKMLEMIGVERKTKRQTGHLLVEREMKRAWERDAKRERWGETVNVRERGEKRRLNKIEGCGVAGRLSEACQKHSRWVSFIFSLWTAVRLAVVLLVALWLCFSALTGWDQCFSTGGSPFQNGPQPVIIKVVYDTWRNLPVWVTIHLHKWASLA